MGLGDEELQGLQYFLLKNPDAGDTIAGTNGARKVRIPIQGRGKSGGGRVIYVDFVVDKIIVLVTAYAKNEQVELTPGQKKEIRNLVGRMRRE